MAKLTAKQQKFADEYLIDLNATQAAIRFYNPNRVFDSKTQTLLVFWSLCVLLSTNITDYNRKRAALLILKYYVPNWADLLEYAPVDSRHDPRVTAWKKSVKIRDGNKCRRCGNKNNLEAHHILPWAEYPQGRIDINNGITLCNSCHANEHIRERNLILNRSSKAGSP